MSNNHKGEVEPETKKFRVFREMICDAVDEEDALQQFEEWKEHRDLEEPLFLVEEYHNEESK